MIFLALTLLTAGLAQAQLSIEITGAGANRIPVTVADFAGDPTVSRIIVGTVRADLERSGLFRIVDAGGVALDENSPVDAGEWKGRGTDALAAGTAAGRCFMGDTRIGNEAGHRLAVDHHVPLMALVELRDEMANQQHDVARPLA